MSKQALKVEINGKQCSVRFNIDKARFEHNFGYRDNNNVRQSRIITGNSVDELVNNINKFQQQIKNQSIHNDNILLKNYIKYYLSTIAIMKNRNSTIKTMESSLNALPNSILNTTLNNLTTTQFQVMYADLNKTHAINTVKNLHQNINTILNYAVKTKLISKNVNNDCIVHNYINGKKIYISIEDILYILNKLKNNEKYYVLYRPVLFLAVSGVRLGECLGLQKQCIDINTGIVKIQAQISAYSGFSTHLKTKSSYRTLQLSKDIINIITQYDNDSNFVFTSRKGIPWTVWSFRNKFGSVFKEIGYPNITPKQFRNSFVKNAVKDNVSLKIIQNILGHSKLSTTMDIYGELADSDTYNVTKSMCSYFTDV